MQFLVKAVTVATAVAAAVGTVAASPASAGSQAHRDPRGDVVQSGRQAEPRPGIDIVSLENTYRGRTLTVSLTTARLRDGGYVASWAIRTPRHEYDLVFDTVSRPRPTTSFYDDDQDERTCPRAQVRIKGETLVGTIPRRCIDRADRVRIAGDTLRPSGSGIRTDDSRRDGASGGLSFGPYLRRN